MVDESEDYSAISQEDDEDVLSLDSYLSKLSNRGSLYHDACVVQANTTRLWVDLKRPGCVGAGMDEGPYWPRRPIRKYLQGRRLRLLWEGVKNIGPK